MRPQIPINNYWLINYYRERTMSRVIHFDLSADNPERAAEFYRRVFNWEVNKWEGPEDYWLIQTGTEEELGVTGGVAGRIKPEDKKNPGQRAIVSNISVVVY